MKQNTKGFTLIELLAVIVILAIIALIATPIILNMINEARKSSAKSSSLGFIDSIEYYAGFAEAKATGMQIEGYSVAVPGETTCTKTKAGGWTSCAGFMGAVQGKSKGKAPDSASIELDANGKVQNGSWLEYNGYYCSYNGSDIPNACSTSQPQ